MQQVMTTTDRHKNATGWFPHEMEQE